MRVFSNPVDAGGLAYRSRRALLALAAIVSAGQVLAFPQEQAQPRIAFDQIDRVLHGEAPPEGDTFTSDAAVIASLPPLKAPKLGTAHPAARTAANMLVGSALALIPYAGPIAGAAAAHALSAEQAAANNRAIAADHAAVQQHIRAGTLSHFAFYGTWVRSDQHSEVTIIKPDQRVTITLDPIRKTAQTLHTTDTIQVDTTGSVPPALIGELKSERLPDSVRASSPVHVYRTTGQIELKHSIGWCKRGTHQIIQFEAVADLPDPLPRPDPSAAGGLGDACVPSTTFSYREPGHLVLSRFTTVDPDSPDRITVLFERGNIRQLGEEDASLFTIPAGYIEEH